jgi:NTP pyrophosphatase (non-canonical NTP hydrolase)
MIKSATFVVGQVLVCTRAAGVAHLEKGAIYVAAGRLDPKARGIRVKTAAGAYVGSVRHHFDSDRFRPATKRQQDWAEVERVTETFRQCMLKKLRVNRHKGDRQGWKASTPRDLFVRLREELSELNDALTAIEVNGNSRERRKRTAHEAADVANFAMMITDVAAGL